MMMGFAFHNSIESFLKIIICILG